MYVCWGDAAPNSTATSPCPWYLPWHHRGKDGGTGIGGGVGVGWGTGGGGGGGGGDAVVAAVQGGVVVRRCGPDGQWVTDGSGRPWRDHSQCEDTEQETPLQVGAGAARYGAIRRDMARYGTIRHDMARYGMIWHDTA